MPTLFNNRKRLLGLICLSLAFVVSLFLTWRSWSGLAIPGCGPGAACDQVLSSRWGELFGIPAGFFGALAYAFAMAAAIRPWPRLVLAVSVLILGGALWFTGIQLFILKQFCPWCSATHAVASAGAVLLILSLPRVSSERTTRRLRWEFVLPLLGLIGFATLQSLVEPRERMRSAEVSRGVEAAGDVMMFHDGRFKIDVSDAPRIGGSGFAVVALTDYTCPHCRALHRTLMEAETELAGRLSVVLLPAFLDANARDLHRILLTVRKIDPAFYEELQEDLISEKLAAESAGVLTHVQERFQGQFYERAWEHSWTVDHILRQTQLLVEENDKVLAVSSLPQLMIGDEILAGVQRLETILDLLEGKDTGAIAQAKTPAEETPLPGKASIVFETTELQLAQVVRGEKATGRFVFSNPGSAPLEILQIKTSCGCTTVDGWQQTVAPGEKGAFEVAFDSSRFMGKISKAIDVTTNAGNVSNGMVRVSIHADVWSPVRLSQYSASFGTLISGASSPPMRIQMTVMDEGPLDIGEPTTTNAAFEVELNEVEAGKRYVLVITPPVMESGLERGDITIPLGHPKMAKIELPAYVRVAQAIEVSPKEIFLPNAPMTEPFTRVFTVINHDRSIAQLRLGGISVSGDDGIRAELKPSSSPRIAQIEVTVPASFDADILAEKEVHIVAETNHPKHPEVRVPLRHRPFPMRVQGRPVARP